MKVFSIFSLCAVLFLFAGCDKNEIKYGETEEVSSDQALLKINYASLYANNRLVVLKINDVRVSNPIAGRTPFPGGGYNTFGSSTPDFLAVNAGDVKLSVSLPFSVDNGLDSVELYSTTLKLAARQYYTAHITDTAANVKTLLMQEDVSRPDTSSARYRVVNLMPNVPAIDLYYGSSATSVTQDSLIAGNVPYLQSTGDIVLKSGLGRTWKIRPAGAAVTNATVLANYTSASTFLERRIYTIFALGYNGQTAAPRRPYVSFFRIR